MEQLTTYELSYAELEAIAAAPGSGRDFARERDEDRAALALVDELQRLDRERAADHVEEALEFWRDELTGYPTLGFSPRYLDARRADYLDWLMSGEGRRTRENLHGRGLEERLERREAAARSFYAEER